jgi:ABC-type polysaccharide/polyol phosphate export permease
MSAFADLREIASYRELIAVLAGREIRARYKHTLLGAAWAVALPVSLMVVFTAVFSRISDIDSGGIPYPVFAYLGLLPWQMHANILTFGARSLTDNRNLVTKVYFAREVLPLSRVLAAFFDFSVAALVLVGLMIWYRIDVGMGVALVPVVFGVQLMLGIGLSFWVSAANLLYRDVQYILQVVVTVWMFASSVVYPIPADGWLRWLNLFNPMTPILNAYRDLIARGHATLTWQFGVAAAISALVLVLGWRWFRHVEGTFGELA